MIPRFPDIRFNKLSDQVFQISMRVDDSNNNLGPQMLAIDTRRFKSYRLVPKAGDLKDMKADFPTGEYVSPFIPVALDGEDLNDWLFAVADHQCSNGAIYQLGRANRFSDRRLHTRKRWPARCPGSGSRTSIKSTSFRKQQRGRWPVSSSRAAWSSRKWSQTGDNLFIAFGFEGSKGTAELKLRCQEKEVLLKGTFQVSGQIR